MHTIWGKRDAGDHFERVGDVEEAMKPRNQRKQLEKDNNKLSDQFKPIPESKWPHCPVWFKKPSQVWRNNKYLVQVYGEDGPAEIRLSICRTTMQSDGRWEEGLSWEELQNIKSEIGYGHVFAVEIYPADYDVVNVANMRHLWLMRNPPAVGWRKGHGNA